MIKIDHKWGQFLKWPKYNTSKKQNQLPGGIVIRLVPTTNEILNIEVYAQEEVDHHQQPIQTENAYSPIAYRPIGGGDVQQSDQIVHKL